MATSYDDIFRRLERFITGHGVDVLTRAMDLEKPGEFDGPTITINPVHDLEARCFYLAHSFGSICQWSTDFETADKILNNLRESKAKPAESRLAAAIEAWRRFEETSSDHAVWVLQEIDAAHAIQPYTVFFRADIEAMTVFHRTGKEPQWPDFFADWKAKVERGDIRVDPFRPKPVPRFRPVRIPKQEVVQERD